MDGLRAPGGPECPERLKDLVHLYDELLKGESLNPSVQVQMNANSTAPPRKMYLSDYAGRPSYSM